MALHKTMTKYMGINLVIGSWCP